MNNLFTLSLEEIFLIQKIQIETNLNTKIKVYLDTNYWNYLADSKDRPEHQYYKLYKALKEKVDSGKIICPVSNINFFETLKQNQESRLRVASVFDELSNLYAIDSNFIFLLEDILFIKSLISEKPDFNFPRLPLWTFAAFIFGDLKFSLPNINKPEFENLKKNIINKIREQTFTDLIFNLSDSPPKLSIFEEFAKNENEISQQIRKLNEILMKKPIWKDVFSFSLIGNIRKSKEKIITTIETFEIPDPKQIYDLLEKKASDVLNLGNYIPSRKITSGIHALFSHDTKRKYEPNDFEDILHSCLALPYFDIFFTDKKNAKILTSDLLSFHTVYNCKIEYNIESCLNILESV